ncbi:MAG: hypothetical protein EAX89_05160 [Candidatus Lokiarchaeota archaeon]|nr:hypothetical protein [Candidatus Lokiarchaeota archaeon]
MRLIDNTFDGHREVRGYNKEEMSSIKNKVLEIQTDKAKSQNLEDFLNSEFKLEVLEGYSKYFNEIKQFSEEYLISKSNNNYFHLKTAIFDEIELIYNNLTNLSSNIRNVKRLIKNGKQLEEILGKYKILLDRIETFLPRLKSTITKTEKEYNNEIYLWINSNKIKNLMFRVNDISENINKWQEVKDLQEYIKDLIEAKTQKKIKSWKEVLLSLHFNELYQYFLSKYEKQINVFDDLLFLLYRKNIIEEHQGEEFINILERKEVVNNLKIKMRPLILALIKDKLEGDIKEIENLDKQYDLTGTGIGKLNVEELLNQKFKDFLPKLVDYYFKGLDKRFQKIANQVDNPEEFIEVVNSCYNKIDKFASKIDEIDTWILRFDNILKPYENITDSLKKSIGNLSSEIYRRKEEYLNYMSNIRDEGLRIELRNFVDKKIEEVNKLIHSYEDETSVIIREELPQLKEIRDLLKDYKEKIDKIKEEVYFKLEAYKEHNIDMYQVIKHWEDNFNRKKQQLTFLLTILINKIFKSFSELIDKESIMFAEISEITKQTENFEGLPINFALSSFLANKLSESELRERITEINAKINQLTTSLGLYQIEASKMEEILSNKVKVREGVSASNVQCTVCHKNINFAKDKLITCPFCASTYHYLCVADWLSKYNSCPMCQNQFLDPNLGIFENE